ncbi:MAG: pantetheine-phosphate adenylyltransferase [Psittacicella sp.]
MSINIAIYPGTFDPLTYGHLDVIKRSASIFKEVIVAVAQNPTKKTLFTLEERLSFIQEAINPYKNVKCVSFQDLLVSRFRDSVVLVRGLRSVADFEYEMQLAQLNKKLSLEYNSKDGIETVFLPPSNSLNYLSSTMVKEVVRHGGRVSSFVHDYIEKSLIKKLNKK